MIMLCKNTMDGVKKHTKFIYEYSDVVSIDDCSKILQLILNSPMYFEHINKSTPKTKVRKNSCINITESAFIDSNLKEADFFVHEIFKKVHLDYVKNNPNYFSLNAAEHLYDLSCSYTYRRYDKSDYYDWHIDSSQRSQLVFSYILYLNDGFLGGDTLFLHQKLKVKPKAGTFLCFPCDFQTVHKSTPIKDGEKHIIWTCMEYHPRNS